MRDRLATVATMQRPRWTADVTVTLLYVSSTLAFTYPLWRNPGTHIAYKPSGDQLFVLSRLEWMRTALFGRPEEFLAGNFYFGSGQATYGDHLMLGYLPIYGPLTWVTQNPVLAYSLTHIAACALNAGAMYATVLRETTPGPMIFVPVSQQDEVWQLWMATEAGAGSIVNGYSGHIWKQYWFFSDVTRNLIHSDVQSLDAGLQAYGIRAVAVDLRRVSNQDRAAWETLARGPWVVDVERVAEHLLITLDDPRSPAAHRWTDLDSTLLADVVEPAAGFTGMLVLHNPTTAAWTPPGDPRVRRVRVEWVRADGSVELEHETDVLPPPFLGPGQMHVTPMHVFTPSEPNNYVLRASTDDEVMFERHVLVAPVQPVAYAGSAKGMAAGLRLRTPANMTLTPRERAPLHVDAFNIGQKYWDAAEANVRFGWRWWKINDDGSETEQPQYEDRLQMLSHVYYVIPPGRGYAFAGKMRAPDEPGRYVVRASMLVELVGWFENEPVEIEVIVKPPDD